MKKTYLNMTVAITHPEDASPEEVSDIAKECMERGTATFPNGRLSAHCMESTVLTTINVPATEA